MATSNEQDVKPAVNTPSSIAIPVCLHMWISDEEIREAALFAKHAFLHQ